VSARLNVKPQRKGNVFDLLARFDNIADQKQPNIGKCLPQARDRRTEDPVYYPRSRVEADNAFRFVVRDAHRLRQ